MAIIKTTQKYFNSIYTKNKHDYPNSLFLFNS